MAVYNQNKWDTNFGVASLTTLFHGWEDGHALIEFPSTHASEGIKTLIEQLITWYPDAPKAQKTDTVMAFWFAELAHDHGGPVRSLPDIPTQTQGSKDR